MTTLKICLSQATFILSNIYIHPEESVHDYPNRITNLCNDPAIKNLPLILAGDFNARHTYWFDVKTNARGTVIEQLMSQLDLDHHNKRNNFTCFHRKGRSIIDLTITNTKARNLITNWSIIETLTNSDHRLIQFEINMKDKPIRNEQPSTWKFKEYSTTDWSIYSSNINQMEIHLANDIAINATTSVEIDSAVHVLTNALVKAAKISLRPKGTTHQKNDGNPWYDNELKQMKNTLNQKRNNYMHENDIHARALLESAFKTYRNKYTAMIRKKKSQHDKNFLEDLNCSSLFDHNSVKMLRSKLTKAQKGLPILDASDPTTMSSKHRQLIKHIFSDDTQLSTTPPLFSDNMTAFTFSELELDTIIARMNLKKAPGPDGISNNRIKHAYSMIKPTLIEIFQKCIKLGYFPAEWKKAQVHLLPKPGKSDYLSAANYRPISLLSNIAKLFEKLISSSIWSNLQENPRYSKNQFGFTKKCSTISALDKICKTAVEHKRLHPTSILAIDIKGAFDNARWIDIVNSLHDLNMPIQLINLVQSFLSNRQIMSTYGTSTVSKDLSKSCPQGSALSPILWNVLLNSLLASFNVSNSKMIAFADDISVILWARNAKGLNKQIKKSITFIHNWCSSKGLELSASKTQILNLHRKYVKPVKFQRTTVQQMQKVKILGVTIGNSHFRNKLNFTDHIDTILNKITRIKNILFTLCKNNYGMNSKLRIHLYKALIRPAIAYASEIWTNHLTKRDLNRLTSAQRSFLLNAIQGYRTVSAQVCNVLSQVDPIIPYLKSRVLRYHICTNQPLTDDSLRNFTQNLGRIESNQITALFLEQEMQIEYEKTNGNFRSFFTHPKACSLANINYFTTQFFSGHGAFGSYLADRHIIDDPNCRCAQTDVQTTEHVLLNCPLFQDTREQIYNNEHITRLSDFISTKGNAHKFSRLAAQIIPILASQHTS